MKKLISIFILFFVLANSFAQAPANCCPDFQIQQDYTPRCFINCSEGNPAGGTSPGQSLVACRGSHVYTVYPNLPGYIYAWTVLGGTPATPTGNPMVITWGNGNQGNIQVDIVSPDGKCKKTITIKFCIADAPKVTFTASPNPVCINQPVQFTSTVIGTAAVYAWDFGDGVTSNQPNPVHAYGTANTYTVVLTVTDDTSKSKCGCKATYTQQVTVNAGAGVQIIPASCKKMFCAGDTSSYCVINCNGPYTYTAVGGVFTANNLSTLTTSLTCVTVKWNTTSNAPASITVTGNCGNSCGNSSTLSVPVMFPNIPIAGPNPVCVGSSSVYTLPSMPGAFYKWVLSGGGAISGPDSNTNTITVVWGLTPGVYTIKCNYHNPITGCKGDSTLTVTVKNKYSISGPPVTCIGSSYYYQGYKTTAIYPFSVPCPTIPGSWSAGGGGTITSTSGTGATIKWTVLGAQTVSATPVNPAAFCNLPVTFNVVVLDTPKVNPIVGPVLICAGGIGIYSVTSNMNAGTFNWTVVGGTFITMGNHNESIQVTWNPTGPYSVGVSQTVNGCSSTVQTITVNTFPNPVILPNAGPFCMDAQTTFTVSPAVGTYTWSINNGLGSLISPQGSNTMTVLWNGNVTPGSYPSTITVTNQCGVPASTTVNVVTPPIHTISWSGSLCSGGVVLSVSPAMSCYQWYKNGVLLPGATLPTYTATTSGYYLVKCPSACDGKAGYFVPREHIPNVNITADNYLIYCIGDPINVNLLAAVHPGCSFQWYNNNVIMGGQINNTLNVTATGSYNVVITCGNCKDTSNTLVVDTIQCHPGSGCDFSFLPQQENINKDLAKRGPIYSGITEQQPLTPTTLTINPPTNPCNNPQFSANYVISPPKTFNSGIFWNYGDGNSFATTPNGGFTPAHHYNQVGTYIVSALVLVNCPTPPPAHICPLLDTIHYTVPIAAYFGYNVNCNVISLTDLSTVIAGCNIAGYTWTVTSGPPGWFFNNPNAASPVLTVNQSGTYIVKLTVNSSCNACTDNYSVPITVTLPSASFTALTPVCALTAVPFTTAGPATNYYNWNFGDGYQSNSQTTTHTFGTNPIPPYTSTVVLTVTDNLGCVATASQNIVVNPPLTVSITGAQDICPGQSVTLATSPVVFQTYQWYYNGNPIAGPAGTAATYTVSSPGSYSVVVTSNGGGCKATSAAVIVKLKHAPIADILPVSRVCLTGGTGTAYLQNSVTSDPNATYSWNVISGPAATFTPNNSNAASATSATFTLPGDYVIVLTATDITTNCSAYDTVCIKVYNSPVFTVPTPVTLCEGTPHTFTALPNIYNYVWNNRVTGNTMTTSLAGLYDVTGTDGTSGCSLSADHVRRRGDRNFDSFTALHESAIGP